MSNKVNSSKMLKLNIILVASAIFAFCESLGILDKINKKCSASDEECLKDIYKEFIQEITDNGVADLAVPKLDPYIIKDASVVPLGMIKVTMKEGEAKGFKTCEATNSKLDLAAQRHKVDFVCDTITVEGSYKVESTPTLLALIGGIDIHGEGNGGMVVEKVNLSFDFAFDIVKLDDGELHFKVKRDESEYNFEVKGKASVHADNVLIGKQEISGVLVNIFNENWEFISNHFGKTVIDRIMDVFIEQAQIVLNKIPAKELITDDLSAYVKN